METVPKESNVVARSDQWIFGRNQLPSILLSYCGVRVQTQGLRKAAELSSRSSEADYDNTSWKHDDIQQST